MIAPAEILVKNASGNVLELVLSGQWNLGQNLPSTEEVLHRLESSVVEQIIFNSQDIAEWDSGLLTFVKRLRKQIEEKAIVLDISGLLFGWFEKQHKHPLLLAGGGTIAMTVVCTIILSIIGHGLSANPLVNALEKRLRREKE